MPEIYVEGLAQLQRGFASADRETRLALRHGLRDVAEPVRRDAEQLAASSITRIGPKWPRMRTGVTRNLVYVAPRQKGVRGRGPKRRPNLADLLMGRAMEPALDAHANEIEGRVEHLLDDVANNFNRGGTR